LPPGALHQLGPRAGHTHQGQVMSRPAGSARRTYVGAAARKSTATFSEPLPNCRPSLSRL
jgi:hypothetical protein